MSTTYAVNGRPTTVDDFASTLVAVQNTGTVPLFIEPLGRTVDVGATVTVPGWSARRTRVRTAGQNGTAVVTLTAGTPAAGPGPGGVTFDPGPAASVSLSISGGTWYSNEGLTTAVSFPVSLVAPTVLYPAAAGSITVTAVVGGTTQVRGMNVNEGSAEGFTWVPSTDAERAAAGVSAGTTTYAAIGVTPYALRGPGALVGSALAPQRVHVGRSETVTTDGTYNIAPGIFRIASTGKVGIIYSSKTAHTSGDGDLKLRTKADPGTGAWSTATTVATAPGGAVGGYQDTGCVVTDDGAIRVTTFTYTGSTVSGLWLISSTDSGATWGAPVALPSTFTKYAAASAPLVDLGSGTWVQPIYGLQTGQTEGRIRVLRTTNYGGSWTESADLLNGNADAVDYSEPYIVKSGTTLVMLVRVASSSHKRMTSTDGGVTWSAATTVLSSSDGRPAMLVASNGAIILAYRNPTTKAVVASTSRDLGLTWTAEQLVCRPPGSLSSVYASMVETAAGEYALACCVEGFTSSVADIRFLYLTEPGTISKNTDGTAMNRALRARGRVADILAFDDLDRPDENPLGYTPSGHRWTDGQNNGHKLVAGKIRQIAADGNIAISTLDAGTANVCIETSFRAPVSYSCGIVLRYIDTANYVMAYIDNGTNITLYKYVAGALTQLAQNTNSIANSAGSVHPLKVVVRGLRCRVFSDGEKLMDYTFSGPEQTLYGTITRHGIRTFRQDHEVGPVVISP